MKVREMDEELTSRLYIATMFTFSFILLLAILRVAISSMALLFLASGYGLAARPHKATARPQKAIIFINTLTVFMPLPLFLVIPQMGATTRQPDITEEYFIDAFYRDTPLLPMTIICCLAMHCISCHRRIAHFSPHNTINAIAPLSLPRPRLTRGVSTLRSGHITPYGAARRQISSPLRYRPASKQSAIVRRLGPHGPLATPSSTLSYHQYARLDRLAYRGRYRPNTGARLRPTSYYRRPRKCHIQIILSGDKQFRRPRPVAGPDITRGPPHKVGKLLRFLFALAASLSLAAISFITMPGPPTSPMGLIYTNRRRKKRLVGAICGSNAQNFLLSLQCHGQYFGGNTSAQQSYYLCRMG